MGKYLFIVWSCSYYQLVVKIPYSGCGGSFIQVGGSYHTTQLMLCVSVCAICSSFSRQLLYEFGILFCVKCLWLGNAYCECSVFLPLP